jgi:hypothetical protein
MVERIITKKKPLASQGVFIYNRNVMTDKRQNTIGQPADCIRCGGAGGSTHWPGYTCYRCNGEGKDPKLTIEEVEVITARDLEKREASNKQYAKLEADDKARRAKERQEGLEKFNPELSHVAPELRPTYDLAGSLFYQAAFKTLSPKQLAVVQREIKKAHKEKCLTCQPFMKEMIKSGAITDEKIPVCLLDSK